MDAAIEIINYIKSITGGFVTIAPLQANHIIKLVENRHSNPLHPHANLFKWQGTRYVFIRTVITTDAIIDEQIIQALNKPQPKECYKYECYNTGNNKAGDIFSLNPELFD